MNGDRPKYADLGDLTEDARIELIGRAVTLHKKTVAFIVEADEQKANRYARKLREKFPGVKILDVFAGPTK